MMNATTRSWRDSLVGRLRERKAPLSQPAFIQRRIVEPILQLLRVGATPRQLAWSIAIGVVIGINPLLGSTTVLALAAAAIFGLNIVASQLANHLLYPFELLLFPVFIRLGIFFFHTPPLPFDPHQLFHAARAHPWETTRLLWLWEWHALVIWAVVAVTAAPLLALALHHPLQSMMNRMKVNPSAGPQAEPAEHP